MSLPPLKTEQWQEVSVLFHATLDQPSQVRADWLLSQTQHDERVREEVLSLLLSLENSDGFLEKPAAPRVLHSLFEKSPPPLLSSGDVTGDFTIERPLGAGSFGTVYLATQNSLGRKIALKVSPNLGEEAQTMAHLTHGNIVSVFSEEVRADEHQRYICMQYVPGTNLELLLEELPSENVTGQSFLQVIDRIGSGDGAFDRVALKDRETIGGLNGIETVLWLGARLAGALAYAHERGILHLDVKPGNILITPYGTPLLTDFNVSRRQQACGGTSRSLVGGTARYMPPEQQRMFDAPRAERLADALDGRADIFALGKLLEEAFLKCLGTEDLTGQTDIYYLVRKCTAADRDDRFETAGKLAAALEGCLELRLICADLPERTPILEFLQRHPVSAFLAFTLIPQIVGSFVNISYNSLRIVNFLTPQQQNLFHWLVGAYNLVVYPACIALISAKLGGLISYLRNPCKAAQPGAPGMEAIRGRILDLPLWVVAGVTLGWMPGSIFFPAAIHAGAGPISGEVFGHFFISFTLSWLIALTYSFLLVQFFLLRAYYPRFWFGSPNIRATARRELAVLRPTLRLFPYMAGFVPLVGAALIVFMGPGTDNMGIFRLLIAFLIGLGMLGLCLALRASHLINQTIYALTGVSLSQLGKTKNS